MRVLSIMKRGSLNTSRTASIGWYKIPVAQDKVDKIPSIARKNFSIASKWMVGNYDKLSVDFDTAIKLNQMLTKDLVPDAVRGKPTYYGRDPARSTGKEYRSSEGRPGGRRGRSPPSATPTQRGCDRCSGSSCDVALV